MTYCHITRGKGIFSSFGCSSAALFEARKITITSCLHFLIKWMELKLPRRKHNQKVTKNRGIDLGIDEKQERRECQKAIPNGMTRVSIIF